MTSQLTINEIKNSNISVLSFVRHQNDTRSTFLFPSPHLNWVTHFPPSSIPRAQITLPSYSNISLAQRITLLHSVRRHEHRKPTQLRQFSFFARSYSPSLSRRGEKKHRKNSLRILFSPLIFPQNGSFFQHDHATDGDRSRRTSLAENRGKSWPAALSSLARGKFFFRLLSLSLSQIVLFKRSRPIGIDQS